MEVDPRYFRPTEVETLLGDPTKAKEKLIDVLRLSNMGWIYNISSKEGLKETYKWYLKNRGSL